MPRLGRPDGDFGGFKVANLAHHDDVGVLAQEGTQAGGEGQAHFRVDVDLVDAGQVDLGRIFRGGDVSIRGIEDVEAGVQGHGFPASGGTGYEDHAVRPGQVVQIDVLLFIVVAKLVDIGLDAG